MILLTQINIVNQPTEVPSQRADEVGIIGVDSWAVVTVEKFMYNGGSEGSMVFIGDGRGFIMVSELQTDVIHMVEYDKA